MSDKSSLEELISTLKQRRDELRVKMHLASAEARQEYDRLSDRINELMKQYEPTKDAATESAEKVFSALKLAGEEMLNGVNRIWKSL